MVFRSNSGSSRFLRYPTFHSGIFHLCLTSMASAAHQLTELRDLLSSVNVPPEVTTHIESLTINSIELFMSWIPSINDCERYVRGVEGLNADGNVARLKMAYRRAKTMVDNSTKRSADGIMEESSALPLSSEAISNLNTRAMTFYQWFKIDPV